MWGDFRMMAMPINKRTYYYALYAGITEQVDSEGYFTGEKIVSYGNPIKDSANISPARGDAQVNSFGVLEDYDKVIVYGKTHRTQMPKINEYSILWVDRMPELNPDGTLKLDEKGNVLTPHDYIVKKVADGLDSIQVAIRKVDVNG